MAKKKETFVKIEDVQSQSQEMIRQMDDLGGRLSELEKRAKDIESSVGFSKFIMFGVIVVFFLAFLTFVFDAWKLHRDAYHEYKATIQNLLKEREEVKQRNESEKLDYIIQELDRLNKSKNSEQNLRPSK